MIVESHAVACDEFIVGGGLTPRPGLRGQARAYVNVKVFAWITFMIWGDS